MKITLASDLHLEFGYQELPGGELLILSGDIAEAKTADKHFHSTKIHSKNPVTMYACSEFFQHECAKYDQVFYVLGNHEHYRNTFQQTRSMLEAICPKNVTILENQCVEYQGIRFLGASLWTDLNENCPITKQVLRQSMNDYRYITWHDQTLDVHYKMSPAITGKMHEETIAYFKSELESNPDKPHVVITHHAPTFKSIHPEFRHEYYTNGGYMSNLDDFILDHTNILVWTHGHVHNHNDYMVGTTRVIANPRGYHGYEKDTGFDPNFTFEIDMNA
jgi:Icc-related predicted phosphoesterase